MPDSNRLNTHIESIKSVGPKRASLFAQSGITNVGHLLYYFPSRHLDRSNLLTSTEAFTYVTGGYDGEVTVIGKVVSLEKKYANKRDILIITYRDGAGYFQGVWFQGANFFEKKFKVDVTYAISGKPTISRFGDLQLAHPDFDYISDDESQTFYSTGKIIPFYRIPKELRLTNIGDLSFRKIITHVIDGYIDYVTETLPAYIIEKHNLMPLRQAVYAMHYPQNTEELERAKHRFKFEELFFIELIVALRKNNFIEKIKGKAKPIKTDLVKAFVGSLPYSLTTAQRNVLNEIARDMAGDEPMNRLLQGDVGSGKTIVAVIAMLIAIDNGFQAAIMAPTEILADQHNQNITNLLAPYNELHPENKINCSLILGGQKKSVRAAEAKKILDLHSQIIIGTHAIFESEVLYQNLGMVIVDEQHRFGVVQRAKLIRKGEAPDCLIMSATPIPRTLSMTVYGDLDISIINEMPKNRIPIKTHLRGESKLPAIYNYVVEEARRGFQTFVVFPLVEESDKLELKAATKHYEELTASYLKDVRVGLLHGRMKWQEKEEVMLKFKEKEFDVLISTTVIEVGIDIPNANIMIIHDAHHFGLSQLHQLRGRVGRGTSQANCILVAPDEIAAKSERFSGKVDYLSPMLLEKFKASIRLQTMVQHLDGFHIAEMDLKLRGPGDIFGIQQSGFPEFKFADIATDGEIIHDAKEEAFKIIQDDPHLKKPENHILRSHLQNSYSHNLQYAKIA